MKCTKEGCKKEAEYHDNAGDEVCAEHCQYLAAYTVWCPHCGLSIPV